MNPTWKIHLKDVDLGEPTSFLDHVYFGCTQRVCHVSKGLLPGLQKNWQKQKPRWNLMPRWYLHGPMTWNVMQSNAWKDICELANKTTEQLYKVATPCMDDHQFLQEENGSVEELSTVCSQIVLTWLYLARIGRPDILWTVNKLVRAVTKWTKACDKRLARLIS